MRFENKVGVFSGASSGMGYLTSECFAKEGGSVVMADINPETLDAAVSRVNAIRPGSAIGTVCDVRDYEQVRHTCDRAVEAFGRIDVVSSFAGGAEMRMLAKRLAEFDHEGPWEFPDVPIEIYDWSLDVNLKGQFYFAHAAMKQMREQKSGVIICIGSISGEEGDAYSVGYCTSKSAAMNGLCKSLARAGAPYGVRAVSVAPGPVLTRAAMANMKTMAGRAADPQEIVDLILYLASEQGAFINGTNILIDGGRNAGRTM